MNRVHQSPSAAPASPAEPGTTNALEVLLVGPWDAVEARLRFLWQEQKRSPCPWNTESTTLEFACRRVREQRFDVLLLVTAQDDVQSLREGPNPRLPDPSCSESHRQMDSHSIWDQVASTAAVLRTAGRDSQPIVVLTADASGTIGANQADTNTAVPFSPPHADQIDAVVDLNAESVAVLERTVQHAMQLHDLRAENRKLRRSLSEQKSKQRRAALQFLREQRSRLMGAGESSAVDPQPPPWLLRSFRDLLRLYVVAGSGAVEDATRQLVASLRQSRVGLREALVAHAMAAEEMVVEVGQRSVWHILGRANLLGQELSLQLSDGSLCDLQLSDLQRSDLLRSPPDEVIADCAGPTEFAERSRVAESVAETASQKIVTSNPICVENSICIE